MSNVVTISAMILELNPENIYAIMAGFPANRSNFISEFPHERGQREMKINKCFHLGLKYHQFSFFL